MAKVKLSEKHQRNLLACMGELNDIDDEIVRAQKAGVPVDEDIIKSCEECRKHLYDKIKTYGDATPERKIVSHGK